MQRNTRFTQWLCNQSTFTFKTPSTLHYNDAEFQYIYKRDPITQINDRNILFTQFFDQSLKTFHNKMKKRKKQKADKS